MSDKTKLDIIVKYNGGTYTTNTVNGCRASSTSGPTEAAMRLNVQLWPNPGNRAATVINGDNTLPGLYRLRLTYSEHQDAGRAA